MSTDETRMPSGSVCLTIFTALIVSFATDARAFTIDVDPVDFVGSYQVVGQGTFTGPTSVSLPEGTYTVSVSGGSTFEFGVDGSGDVSSSSVAATGIGNTLSFNTGTVHIDANDFLGGWYLNGALSAFMSSSTSSSGQLLLGLNYTVIVSGNAFTFAVDGSGNVSSSSAAATGIGNTLFFNTGTVHIDPNDFPGGWYLNGALSAFIASHVSSSGQLVLGLQYKIVVGGGGLFTFAVDGSGDVSSSSPAATGVGNTLTFNTGTVTIDASDFPGGWYVNNLGAFIASHTSSSGQLVLGLQYKIVVGGGGLFTFAVDGSGDVSSSSPAATGVGNELIFNTGTVTIDASDFPGGWYVNNLGAFIASHTSSSGQLVLGLQYTIVVGGGDLFTFAVDGNGDVSSSSAAATGIGSTLTFNTVTVNVDASNYVGGWYLNNLHTFIGSEAAASAQLVPGLNYQLIAEGLTLFSVAGDCTVVPDVITLSGGTFNITCSINQPPVAHAGPDLKAEHASSSGTPVTLDGSGSTDPDEDPLTYTWTGPFSEGGGTVTGVNPSVTLPLGAHTISIVVDDGIETDMDDVDVSIVITPNSYSLIAQHSMLLKKNSSIHSGHVGGVDFAEAPYQADGVEMVVGIGVLAEEGVVLKAPNVKVKQNATILGELVYNDLVSVGSGVTMAQQTMAPASDWPLFQGFGLPAFETATPGALVIDVPQGGSDTATPDSYDLIKVRKNGTLIFSAGHYDLRELDAGDNTSLLFQGPATLRIKERFAISKNSFFGPDAGSGIDASDIIVYVEGINGNSGNVGATPKAAKVGLAATFQGNLYAQNGTVYLRQNSQSTGSFIGKWAIVGIGADLTLQSGWDTPGVIYSPPAAAKRTVAAQSAAASDLAGSDSIFAMTPARPNPFNPETTIGYSLTQPSHVRLTIYNTLGQEVQLLVEGRQVAGVHSAVWDGRDAGGLPAAAGVYLYRLSVNGRAAAGRMVLAK